MQVISGAALPPPAKAGGLRAEKSNEFAGQALAGQLARHGHKLAYSQLVKERAAGHTKKINEGYARISYQLADAMIAESERKRDG